MNHKIDICAPLRELTEDEVKYTLRNKEAIIISIHEKMYFIQKDISQTDDMIEMASFRSTEITDMPSGKGTHKDLADVLLKYYKYMDDQKKQYTDLFRTLIDREMRTERIWMCFLLLDEPYYGYIKRLYVDGEKYDTVEAESGFSRQVFGKYRKEAMELIIRFYNSDKNMLELSEQSQKSLLHKEKEMIKETKTESIHQLSFMELLNNK